MVIARRLITNSSRALAVAALVCIAGPAPARFLPPSSSAIAVAGSGLPASVARTLVSSPPPAAQAAPSVQTPAAARRVIRMHGVVEPERSHTVSAPRLSGSGTPMGPLIVVRLARAGTLVKKGDLVVEFDRHAQLKSARDREAEYRELLEQLNKKRAEQRGARAMRDTQLRQAENEVRIAELGVLGNEMVPKTTAEKNVQTLEEAKARLAQLRTTFQLRARAEAADLRILELQRDRAANAWRHAQGNADKMRILAPLDGLVVLKSIWKSGTMAEVQEGEEVRSGIPILDVVDPSAMRVRANINQADVEGLAAGMTARITLDSYPGRQFDGRLQHLSPIATTSMMSSRVRTFIATFTIDGTDPHLLPDLAAAIEVSPGSETSAPAAAGPPRAPPRS